MLLRTGFCWSTVRKYADEVQLPVDTTTAKPGMMYEEKLRRNRVRLAHGKSCAEEKVEKNNKIIFEQLEKLGFLASYRTVCTFIRDRNDSMIGKDNELKEEYER